MKKRILFLAFPILAVALIAFSVISAVVYYNGSLTYAQESLRAYMGAFDETRTAEKLTEEYALFLSERLQGIRVTFLSEEGTFLADSVDNEEESRADRPEVIAAQQTGEGFDVRSSDTISTNLVYYCRAFSAGGYLVRLALPTGSLWSIFARSIPLIVVFLLVDLGIAMVLTWISTGIMLRPVEQLAREAAEKQHVTTSSPELEGLARIMNEKNEKDAMRLKELDEERKLVIKAQQSKNDFIANITHEMNTPLTSIKGFAELLAAGALKGEQAERAAGTILSQSERLSNLITSIIHYNEIDSEELPVYEVDASKLTKELLEVLSPEIARHKLVLLSQIDDGVILLSRFERVNEIAGNLIRNAIRYNREGGSISVLLTKEELVVSDTGIGIAEENLERIFDRFFTVDKSHNGKNGGFGLGLAAVKKLCKQAGWELSVKSKLNEGTTFRVNFS